ATWAASFISSAGSAPPGRALLTAAAAGAPGALLRREGDHPGVEDLRNPLRLRRLRAGALLPVPAVEGVIHGGQPDVADLDGVVAAGNLLVAARVPLDDTLLESDQLDVDLRQQKIRRGDDHADVKPVAIRDLPVMRDARRYRLDLADVAPQRHGFPPFVAEQINAAPAIRQSLSFIPLSAEPGNRGRGALGHAT